MLYSNISASLTSHAGKRACSLYVHKILLLLSVCKPCVFTGDAISCLTNRSTARTSSPTGKEPPYILLSVRFLSEAACFKPSPPQCISELAKFPSCMNTAWSMHVQSNNRRDVLAQIMRWADGDGGTLVHPVGKMLRQLSDSLPPETDLGCYAPFVNIYWWVMAQAEA